MRIRRPFGVAMVLLLAATGAMEAAAAAPTGNPRLTKKQWVRAANRICDAADQSIDGLDQPTADLTGPLTSEEFEEVGDYTDAAREYSVDALADLRDLRPPKRDAAKVRRILRALDDGIAAFEASTDAARSEDQAPLEAALNDAAAAGDAFEAAAKAYGSTCGASD